VTVTSGLAPGDGTDLYFERRGNSRSRLHGAPRPLSLAEQSGDAIAVLRANRLRRDGPAAADRGLARRVHALPDRDWPGPAVRG
jgi:hypothetical protein